MIIIAASFLITLFLAYQYLRCPYEMNRQKIFVIDGKTRKMDVWALRLRQPFGRWETVTVNIDKKMTEDALKEALNNKYETESYIQDVKARLQDSANDGFSFTFTDTLYEFYDKIVFRHTGLHLSSSNAYLS